ncbi:MAG: AraC family transcriptional regulator [Peptococcaceae bacterium]|nr:AraC family transcriptional regulator [Peptococcaceae bacterium]
MDKSIIKMQSSACSKQDQAQLFAFDRESVATATEPVLYQGARFLLITKGQGLIRIRGKEFELRPDALVSILPWDIVEIFDVRSTLQYQVIRYCFRTINDILKLEMNIRNEPVDMYHVLSDHPVVHCTGKAIDTIKRIFRDIEEEIGLDSTLVNTQSRPLSAVGVAARMIELQVTFVQSLWNDRITLAEKESHSEAEIFQYIATHLSEKITLKKLSSLFGSTETAISNYIRRTVGLSLSDLLNEMRVVTTINYLLYTDLTLEQIAEVLGFVDSSHLSKVFAARMGDKVNQYRKTYGLVNEICKVRNSRIGAELVNEIYQNYNKPINARSVAGKFGVTVNEMNQILMYHVETNFAAFLNSLRVKKACALLLATEESVNKIALTVGYHTIKAFNRQFLRIMGTSPRSFRKANRLAPDELNDRAEFR